MTEPSNQNLRSFCSLKQKTEVCCNKYGLTLTDLMFDVIIYMANCHLRGHTTLLGAQECVQACYISGGALLVL